MFMYKQQNINNNDHDEDDDCVVVGQRLPKLYRFDWPCFDLSDEDEDEDVIEVITATTSANVNMFETPPRSQVCK